MNKKLFTLPVVFVAAIAVATIAMVGITKNPIEQSTDNTTASTNSVLAETVVTDNRGTTNDMKNIAELQQENPDIYAWITVPGTEIDFPILQSEEDNYYLNRQVDGSEGLPGSIFTNAVDGKEFDRGNTVIYGHNMKNGSYFGQLHLFEDQTFFENNNIINIYLSDRKLTYRIVISSTFGDSYLPEKYEFSTAVGCKQFLNDVVTFAPNSESTSQAETVDLGEWNQLITLSTCVSGVQEERYLVIGALEEVELYE